MILKHCAPRTRRSRHGISEIALTPAIERYEQKLGVRVIEEDAVVLKARQRYVLISEDEYSRLEDLDAIRQGIAHMESGQGQPLGEAMNDIRRSLQSRP